MVRAALCLLSGFLLTYAMLVLILEAEFPGSGFAAIANTFSTAFSLMGGGEEQWFVPIALLLRNMQPLGTVILLIPAAFFVFGSLVLLVRRSALETASEQVRFAQAALLYLGVMWVLVFSMHYFFMHFWLSQYYCNIYFFPASILVLISLAGAVEARWHSPHTLYIGSLAIILLWLVLPFVWLWIDSPIAALWTASVAIVAAGITLGVLLYGTQRRLSLSIYFASFLIISFYPLTSKIYHLVANPEDRQLEWDVYRGAVFLQRFINTQVPTDKTIGFWYRNPRSGRASDWLLTSVQSMFLWSYSRVAPYDTGHPGMPLLDARTRTSMAQKKFLVLLGTSDPEMKDALNAIAKAGLPFGSVARTNYVGQTWGFQILLLKADPRPLRLKLFEVPVSRLVPAHGSEVSEAVNGRRFITGSEQYGYHLLGPVQAEGEQLAGPAVIRVELEVQAGEIGVAVDDAKDISKLLGEVDVTQSKEPETIDIEIPDLASAGRLIVRNYRSTPSTVIVHSIQVFRPN
jgi:hypothetical protein